MSVDWFARNWMYAGAVAGLFLLALVPLLVGAWSLPLLLVYLGEKVRPQADRRPLQSRQDPAFSS